MNKLVLVLSVFFMMGMYSCDKEYTCVCYYTNNGQLGDEINRTTISAGSSADASEECDRQESWAFPDRCQIEE